MQKVIIKDLNLNQIAMAEMQDPTAWIADCVANNVWGLPEEYTVEITDITAEHELKECIKKRKAEYPSPEEFMNAYFDGGEPALQALNAARLAVKQKYPKP